MRPLDAVQEANPILLRLVDDESVDRPAAHLSDAIQAHFADLSGGSDR